MYNKLFTNVTQSTVKPYAFNVNLSNSEIAYNLMLDNDFTELQATKLVKMYRQLALKIGRVKRSVLFDVPESKETLILILKTIMNHTSDSLDDVIECVVRLTGWNYETVQSMLYTLQIENHIQLRMCVRPYSIVMM